MVGVGATWLPWFLYDDRPIFLFYAVAIVPFLVLALVLCLGRLMGPDREPSPRRTAGVIVGGAFLVLTILNFAWLWPILTYEVLEYAEWRQRIWFSRWI